MDLDGVDYKSDLVDDDQITLSHELPALGVDEMERNGRAFHIVDAHPQAAEELAETLGAIPVDFGHWDIKRLIHQLDVLSTHEGPQRIVFGNLTAAKWEDCFELQKFVKKDSDYPVKSVWFVDDGQHIETNIHHKVLMECDMVDAATLMDAVAFGWGSKNPYNGKPVDAATLAAAINHRNQSDHGSPTGDTLALPELQSDTSQTLPG